MRVHLGISMRTQNPYLHITDAEYYLPFFGWCYRYCPSKYTGVT